MNPHELMDPLIVDTHHGMNSPGLSATSSCGKHDSGYITREEVESELERQILQRRTLRPHKPMMFSVDPLNHGGVPSHSAVVVSTSMHNGHMMDPSMSRPPYQRTQYSTITPSSSVAGSSRGADSPVGVVYNTPPIPYDQIHTHSSPVIYSPSSTPTESDLSSEGGRSCSGSGSGGGSAVGSGIGGGVVGGCVVGGGIGMIPPPIVGVYPAASQASQVPPPLVKSTSLHRPQGHPLKSFSVPGPPPTSPSNPQTKHISAQQQMSNSPYKKTGPASAFNFSRPLGIGTLTSPKTPTNQNLSAAEYRNGELEVPESCPFTSIKLSVSTEELSQEMANLEGLMKDLSAITQSDVEA